MILWRFNPRRVVYRVGRRSHLCRTQTVPEHRSSASIVGIDRDNREHRSAIRRSRLRSKVFARVHDLGIGMIAADGYGAGSHEAPQGAEADANGSTADGAIFLYS
jgi:hypothetical protein